MRLAAISFAALLTATLHSPAAADCTCRGPGVVAHHGQTVCLHTPDGPRLARCEMVLNNSSWTFLPDPCPEASGEGHSEFAAAMSVAPVGLILIR
jgi:hypothetical protein